ncbi:MAG: hypothetical protein GPOALKHO_001152 [Sodalis sp.]|nr:MAG: hypothetical protein GPOALKHO_001152 [Sodalis sp.]
MAIVGDDYQRAIEIDKHFGERDNQRQHQPHFLTAEKTRCLVGDFIALKAEAAQRCCSSISSVRKTPTWCLAK